MDGSDPAENYRKIRRELEAFSPTLAEKREIIAANKMDLAIDNDAIDHLRAELSPKEVYRHQRRKPPRRGRSARRALDNPPEDERGKPGGKDHGGIAPWRGRMIFRSH